MGVMALIRKHKILSALLALTCLIAGIVVWEVSARVRGQLSARVDLARGHYRVLTLGLPTPWRPEDTRLLRERYGIEERMVAGCIVSKSLLAYAEGYNTMSMAAANRKFGHDIFKETAADAIKSMNAPSAAGVR